MSSGEATREADDYFGDPVIEAARLCARAEGGQILASDLVRANAGRRSAHTFTSLGELELKGLPEPIETLQVGWEPLEADAPGSGRVPLPARLTHRPAVGVIGREHELALLDAAAKRVACGEGRELILLAGEPGQGKTTLVSEIARHAHDGGHDRAPRSLRRGGGCTVSSVPRGARRTTWPTPTRRCSEPMWPPMAGSWPAWCPPSVSVWGSSRRPRPPIQTPSATSSMPPWWDCWRWRAARRPVVLVLDDLHWADKPSLQLLRHVVANTSATRLLILGTYRDAELSAAHPLTEALAALHREPTGVSTIDLKGLEDTGVIAFMESAAGHELDDAGVGLAHQLYRETDGNPFFVAEMLRNLSESGEIFQDASTGRWTAKDTEGPFSLPHSVRTVIGTRVSRLGEGATKVLSTASVIGRDFDLDLLAETTKVDEDELIDLLDEAQRAAVVHELPDAPGRYSFSHALVQHTLYEDLGGTRRTRLHKAVGEAIERLYGENSEDARRRTGPTLPPRHQAHRRGQGHLLCQAGRRRGPGGARSRRRRALLLPGARARRPHVERRPLTRIDLLIGLGTAQRQAGIASFRETLLEAARAGRRSSATPIVWWRRHWPTAVGGSVRWGRSTPRRSRCSKRRSTPFPRPTAPSGRVFSPRLCSELIYHSPLERRLALADEAKAIARRLGDRATFVDVVYRCATASQRPFDARHGVGGHRGGIRRGQGPGRPRGPAILATMALHACRSRRPVRAGQGTPGDFASERRRSSGSLCSCGRPATPTPRSPCCTATPKRPSSSPPRRSRWARQADSPTPLRSTACSS